MELFQFSQWKVKASVESTSRKMRFLPFLVTFLMTRVYCYAFHLFRQPCVKYRQISEISIEYSIRIGKMT